MNVMKRLAATLVMVLGCAVCMNAQTRAYFVNFAYDDDGNRVSRVITIGNDRYTSPSTDTTEMAHYTDIIDANEIRIYPNPTSSTVFVNITHTDAEIAITAAMMSVSGTVLKTRQIGAAPVVFDLSGMASGIYFLELRSKDETHTWKIIKR